MRPIPFAGIGGCASAYEYQALTSSRLKDAHHFVSIGVSVSPLTLIGKTGSRPKRYPLKETLPHIFSPVPGVLNLAQFSSEDHEHLGGHMVEVQELLGPHCSGIQLNSTWPDLSALEYYRKAHPDTVLVLGCGPDAIKGVEASAAELAKRVEKYAGLIDYVIVDQSGGRGLPFSLSFAQECFSHLEKISDLGFGVAGGIHPGNLHMLAPLYEEFGDFSFISETKLRTDGDDLDVGKAQVYLQIIEACWLKRSVRLAA